ncbi:MAG: DinB family protein [Bacteroidota bacterium]
MNRNRINALIDQFEALYQGEPWLDETFVKKLENLDESRAFTRPMPNVHSVGEIISHLVAWRNDIVHRLQGNPRQLFMESPDNWTTNQELQSEGWKALKERFATNQQALIALLRERDDSFLNQVDEHSSTNETFEYLLEGLVHHDCYHLGQIGLIITILAQ